MRHNGAEQIEKDKPVVKCKQRLKELRYHGIFKGFYCKACDKYLIKE